MTAEAGIDKYKLRRFIAAYKLRLAEKAQALGARPETWGQDQRISIDEEKSYLSREDHYRLAPYPFPGLRSFERDEGELFFGRERNVETLRSILAECRLVVVLGGSGSGKSSLVRAGLLPFLNTERRIKGRDGNWYSIDFRPRTDPFGELSSALVDQVLGPLLRMRRKGLPQALGLPEDVDINSDETIKLLRDRTRQRFADAREIGRQQVLNTLLEIVDKELDAYDNIVTRGRRLANPNLFLLVDQLEEVFRPEVARNEREALLDLIVDLHSHMQDTSQRGGLFLAATIRSEEVYRCAEHRGLSDVVIGRGGYQIELLDPDNEEDARSIRAAIIQPARNVFRDWGLEQYLDHDDAPFEKGLPDLLLKGAARLSVELNHRPDQLPLLQHALQAMWHAVIRRWSDPKFGSERLEITRRDLPGQAKDWEIPDLSACLNARADKAKDRAVELFVEITKEHKEVGVEALRAAFRALARRDDQGNWARRFAGRDEITAFLTADPASAVAKLPDEPRWNALREALRVFLLRGYLSQGTERKFDISHEALIRNWPLFLDWLREPEEVAYALGRVLMEVKEPEKFKEASDDEKMRLIPKEVADRVTKVAEGGALPTRWGEDQIAPYLLRPVLRNRWGAEKQQALQQLTQLAGLAEKADADKVKHEARKTVLKSIALFGGFLAILAIGSGYQIYATFEARVAEERVKAANDQAKDAAAYSLIGSMQYETTWPIGLSERTAIHALTMLNGGGQVAPSGLLHETAWLNWHTGVRNILGHQLRITPLDTLPTTTQQPACLTFRENSPGNKDPAPFESEPVFLAATPKTAVRLSISPSGPEPSHVFFETQRNGGGWAPAGPEGNSLAVPVGTRLCLAPNGSAATISYLGSSLPYMLELSWYPCGGDQKTCQDKPWQVTWRRMENRTPGDMSFPGLFNCVRALNVSSPSEKDLSRIDADFTDELPEVCDSPGPTGDGRSKVGLFRASYVPGMMSATLNEGAKKPLNFIKCTGKKDSRECELPNTIGKLFVNRDNSSSDYWAMSVYPVVPDYPIKNVVIAASTIAQVAVDERRNLWITDGKGHFWMLINDRSAMEQELWRRSEPLLRSSDWYGRFPEIKMNMTPSDLQNRGPLPAPNTQPNN